MSTRHRDLLLSTGLFCAIASVGGFRAAAQDAALESAAPPGNVDDVPPGWIPPGWIVIEGDIQVPEDFLSQPEGTYITETWSGKTVPFEFAAGVTQASQTAALSAMGDWEAVTDVNFVPRTNQANWVRIQNSNSGNNSAVGMVGGMQVINIENWNAGTLRHELGHCLGFWHEQSRADRDSYISVNYGNICQNCCNGGSCSYNFDIRPPGGGEYGPYDFQSIMHYSQWAFSVCSGTPGCETIVCKPAFQAFQNQIGTFNNLSFWDARVMSFLYPEDNWRFLDASAGTGLIGTFFFPYKTASQAKSGTPVGGLLWIQPGTYSAVGVWDKAMTLRAPLGGVTLGN